ncbi:MAG: hypothetical protein LBK95_04630 [Bifidobacteriaceae bacterium]|nr:hypothetical protein [Bifidobacteriaceae bacterium]
MSATLVAGWFVFLLWALSGWLGFEGGVSGWLQQAAPPVGILLALLNLAIARVAPAWLVVVYAVATATAVTLPYLSPGGDIVYRAWALGLIGMLGTAFGLRPLQSPGAKQDEDYPEPLPPASANADEE